MAEIRDYIAYQLLNSDAARNLIEEIRAEVLRLRQIPDYFRPVDEEPWDKRSVRKLMVKNL